MIRNWEIIRSILIKLENTKTPNAYIDADSFENFSAQEVAYNMRILSEAGHIEAKILSSGNGEIDAAIAIHLTSSGHDLLDTIRSNNVWEKVKEKFTSAGIDMTFDLVLSVGKKLMEAMLY
jgi:hypothetical protein